MERSHDTHDTQALAAARTAHLVRDLLALDALSPSRLTAAERLDTMLGPELVGAVRSRLGLSTPGVRRRLRPGRAA